MQFTRAESINEVRSRKRADWNLNPPWQIGASSRNLSRMNPTDSTELERLRKEVAALRRDLDHVLRVIGQDTDGPEQPRPRFLCLETESIGLRNEWTSLPILLKAQEDSASIFLHDSKMRLRGRIEVNDKEGASFQIWNADGQLVVSIGETESDGGQVCVADREGKPRAGIKANEWGGTVSVQNAAGVVEAVMVAKESGGKIMTTNAEGRPVAEMFGDERGGTVCIREVTGQAMAYMSGAMERGVVSVFNEHGDAAASLSSDDFGGALLFYDSDGATRSSLP